MDGGLLGVNERAQLRFKIVLMDVAENSLDCDGLRRHWPKSHARRFKAGYDVRYRQVGIELVAEPTAGGYACKEC